MKFHKVYASRIFSRKSRSNLIFWQEKGTKVLKENIGKELERHKKVLKERKKHGMNDQVLIFSLIVPIQYKDIIDTNGYIKQKMEETFSNFKFKVLEKKDLGEVIRTRIRHNGVGKYECELIIKDCLRAINCWEKQEDQYLRKINPGREKYFLGLKK